MSTQCSVKPASPKLFNLIKKDEAKRMMVEKDYGVQESKEPWEIMADGKF